MSKTPEWLKKLKRLPDLDLNLIFHGGHKQWVPKGWIAPKEKHITFEIMLILGGKQETVYRDFTDIYTQDDIILIPPGMSHENRSVGEEGLEYFCVHFNIGDPSIQHNIMLYCNRKLDIKNPHYESIHSTILTLIDYLENEPFSIMDKLVIHRELINLVTALIQYSETEEMNNRNTGNTILFLAKRISETIQKNYKLFTDNPTEVSRDLISIQKIAENLNMSHSYMLKIFREVYGMSQDEVL